MTTDSNYLITPTPEKPDVVRRHPKLASVVAPIQAKPSNHATAKVWPITKRCEFDRDSNYLDASRNGKNVAPRGTSIAIAPRKSGFQVAP